VDTFPSPSSFRTSKFFLSYRSIVSPFERSPGTNALINSCITQLKAQGPSRTCNESREEQEEDFPRAENSRLKESKDSGLTKVSSQERPALQQALYRHRRKGSEEAISPSLSPSLSLSLARSSLSLFFSVSQRERVNPWQSAATWQDAGACPLQGYLAHKKQPPNKGHHSALGVVLL